MHYEYIYDQNRYESQRSRQTTQRIRNVIVGISLILLGYYMTGLIVQVVRDKNIVTIASPLAEPVTASIDTIRNVVNPSGLPAVVSKSLEETAGTYAVAIKNLKTGESYYINEKRKFDSASLYKLWVMAAAYKKIEEGSLDKETVLQEEIATLNKKFDIATESAELTEGTFNMNVENALNQMIVISHNYAALALTQKIGLTTVSNFLKNYNFASSKVGSPPQTTAGDIAQFYEMLYKGELATPKTTQEMIALLKKQQLNDRIPKYLPDNIEVGHKTGELGMVKHDAGIVFTPKGDYIIVTMSESNNPKGAAEREALLSKAVYEYFQNR